MDFIPRPPSFYFPGLGLWQGEGLAVLRSRELLVRLWLDMDIFIPLVSLSFGVEGALKQRH